MAFLTGEGTEYLVEKLSDSKNIKITGNQYGNRVNNVVNKLVEKADNVTKAVEQEVINDSHMFKVGTGDVDISSDVEDGFGKIGLKGKTYQNVFNDFRIEPGLSSQYFTVDGNEIKCNKPIVTEGNIKIKYYNSLVQLNKVYTLVFYIYKNTLQRDGQETENYNVSKFNLASYNSGVYFITKGKTGLVKVKLQQPTTVAGDGKPYLEVYGSSVGELEISQPVLLEGDYTNDPNLPLEFFEGIIGVGDKSKNLFDTANLEIGSSEDVVGKTWSESKIPKLTRVRLINEIKVNPNTTYTLNTTKGLQCVIKQFNAEGIGIADMGWIKTPYSFTTNSNTDSLVFMLKYEDSRELKLSDIISANIQLEEGSTPTKHQPYGTNVVDVLSCGKNLWDLKNKSVQGFIEHATGNLHIPDCKNRTSDFIRVKPGITYTYMTTVDVFSESHPISWNAVAWYDENYNFIVRSVKTGEKMGVDTIIYTLTSPTNAAYVRVGSRYLESDFSQATFSEGVISEHIPYEEDDIQILLDEPLMGLPNGVCDEITIDGKLIRRVGKVVVDSSSDIRILHEQELDKTAYCNIHWAFINEFSRKHHTPMISNIMPYNPLWNCDIEGVNGDHETLSFRVEKSKLSELTSAAFREYLLPKNPVVYYQLANPIITKFPTEYLRFFKDGYLKFNTMIAPESTHKVQLNKSAQIESCIQQVSLLDRRVENIEALYDDLLLQTSRGVDLLSFDYNLETGDE